MSTTDLTGKVAIVTGASLGIGRSAALELGKAGAKVVINYRSHTEQAEAVVNEIKQSGSDAIAVQADVSDYEAVSAMVQQAVDHFGQLDIAVSNAAYSDREFYYEANLEDFRRTVDVTMWGAFYLLQTASQQFIRQETGGAIVMVSSPHAVIAAPKAMAYNMSKAAVEHMSKTAAIEAAQFGIRINIIQPGWTDTPGERKFASEDTLETAGAKIPLGRLGTPEEMGKAILYLCDPNNSYMTGATLLIDGGISLPWWASRGSAAPE
ncbi:MAG: SDR family NAD(P)-dependent oxidoreductase [Pirellulales bacterium]